jgi:hypothetical protein
VGSPGSHQPIIDTSGISIAILLRKWLISLLVGASQRAIKVVVGPSLPYLTLPYNSRGRGRGRGRGGSSVRE